MVTSPLSSNNVPCNVHPLADKKKSHSKTEPPAGTSNCKNSSGKSKNNKENIVKGKDPFIDIKKDLTSKKKSDKSGPEHQEIAASSASFCNTKSVNLEHCEFVEVKRNVRQRPSKESNLEEVGKLLQEALYKSPLQNKEGNGFPVAEASNGGSDTGYSSRCSTPPAPISNSDPNERSATRRNYIDPVIIPFSREEENSALRSESPSTCSDSSVNSCNPGRGRNYYHHQRFGINHHHTHRGFQHQYYILPCAKGAEEDYKKRNNDNMGINFRIKNQGNYGMNYQYRKVDRIPFHHGLPQHSHHNSSHEREYENVAKQAFTGRQFIQTNQRVDGRGRNWNFNQRHHNVKNNHQFWNPNFQHRPNGVPNNPNIYYQADSHGDLRENVWGFQRRLSDQAGTFMSPDGQNKWNKDHRTEATIIPPELLNKSKWDGLSLQVWNMFSKHQQLDCTFRAKMELKQRIIQVLWNVLPMCRLFVVGSSLSGFGANSSDVDMCIMVTPRDLDQRNEAQAVLRLLQRELNNCGFVEKMELITAKVPILKFRDFYTKIDVDLNCNNSVGIRNTHLLNAYSQLDWRVRPLVLVVKLWAQHHHINNAKDMTISSYSLVLMVIHYLQYGLETPLLPCLHKAFPDKFNPSNHVFKMPVTERMPLFISKNTQTLGELFLGFLEYFSNKFTFFENTISIRTGGILPTEECRYVRSKKNDSRMWKYLCIEEPFDLTNTARSVYDEVVFEKVRNVFKDSYKVLEESKDLDSIFSKP